LVQLGAGRAQAPQKGAVAASFAEHELSTLQQRRWSTLSGGERARVLLAMVLVVDPQALLADEPGASLHIRHRIDVVKALVRRSKDRLSVVVMHDLDLAFRYFDRVIVIDRGSIVADAAPSALIYDQRASTRHSGFVLSAWRRRMGRCCALLNGADSAPPGARGDDWCAG
jgi:iron complex transport system ATP-binding protein